MPTRDEVQLLEKLLVEDLGESVERENVEALAKKSEELLGDLDEEERRIMGLRFGFDRFGPRTLEAVAEAVNLPLDEVRQIEQRAMDKLRQES
jgi:DNA-directed RNA polymerase sigma subunit (sigma70/sigma32)